MLFSSDTLDSQVTIFSRTSAHFHMAIEGLCVSSRGPGLWGFYLKIEVGT